jgi:hypothetical protein
MNNNYYSPVDDLCAYHQKKNQDLPVSEFTPVEMVRPTTAFIIPAKDTHVESQMNKPEWLINRDSSVDNRSSTVTTVSTIRSRSTNTDQFQ